LILLVPLLGFRQDKDCLRVRRCDFSGWIVNLDLLHLALPTVPRFYFLPSLPSLCVLFLLSSRSLLDTPRFHSVTFPSQIRTERVKRLLFPPLEFLYPPPPPTLSHWIAILFRPDPTFFLNSPPSSRSPRVFFLLLINRFSPIRTPLSPGLMAQLLYISLTLFVVLKSMPQLRAFDLRHHGPHLSQSLFFCEFFSPLFS